MNETRFPGGAFADLPDNAVPAATVVIFRDRPGEVAQLLMVERSDKMNFAAGAAVFAGGRIDDADMELAIAMGSDDLDETAARIAAVRETIEETGIAVGIVGSPALADLSAARQLFHEGASMADVCERFGWELDLSVFTPFSRWRPPTDVKRVFDTRFYLAAEDDDSIEAEVDGTENYRLFWTTAQDCLDRADRGEVKIIFPTRRNLERLAQFSSLAEGQAHVAQYPPCLVQTFVAEREGEQHLCLPEGIGYPVLSEPLAQAMRG